ncbi:TonB-dependent receptor [Pedobacter metabolipauper]|uniref:Carboxypeptidase-like protein n=1 Tax=Pedobacter metabolipauper TaxID=425513 RepID=A0A4V3D1M3_9SPHI|nr:carboxypeptidase-like regulatory domain-containing protein [Pedobacter metabolipauper]TDQ11753.1 hypothetical protein ATK78_0881 [Pedobacter metabolipauper]
MSRLLRVYHLIIIAILSVPGVLNAQVYNFNGSVKSTSGIAVSNATITLKLKDASLALGYATTDNTGKFSITTKTEQALSNLVLEVNHLSYKRKQIPVLDNVFRYDVVLEESAALLDEVVIKSRPKVTQNKDTISYHVEGFAKKEDRSIGDVLKRIPGIEIGENGEVKFNNKPISNFYIDGDDILGGKYGIGTKTIPHGMVDNVQIYDNHEHVKALKNKNSTDKVALNLEIKDDARLKLVGNAKAGFGLPKKYDPEVNAILLNKNYKMLNVAKGNNIGDDLSIDVLDLLSGPAVENSKMLVSSSTVSTPYVSKKRYYDNNSGMLNANNFFKFKDSLQLKTNLSILRDKNQIAFNSLNDIYTQNGTVRFLENQSGYKTSNLNSLTVSAEKNKADYYFQDEFRFRYNENRTSSSIFDNENAFAQHLKDRSLIFSNNLSYIPVLKNNNTLYINWKFTANHAPQQLELSPGIHEDIINGGNPYQQLHQQSSISVFSNHISGNYRINKGKINQSYGLTLQSNYQNLKSDIDILEGSYKDYQQGSNDNSLKWQDHSITGTGFFEYTENRIEASLSLPVKSLNISYRDTSFQMKKSKNYLLLNPNVRFSYRVNSQDRLILKYNSDYFIDDITTLYRGYVFTNYRTFRNNENNGLAEQRSHALNMDYNIKRPIEMFFANIAASYSIVNRNVLTSTIVSDNNILQQSNLSYHNQIKSYGINTTLSKYIFPIGTTLTLKPGWSHIQLKELINNDIYSVRYNNYELSANIDFQLFKKIGVEHRSNIRYISNNFRLAGAGGSYQSQKNYNYRQSISVKYAPADNFFINVEGQSIHITQERLSNINIYFIDANFRLKIPNWKADLELSVTNIMNSRSLTTYSINNTSFVNNEYRLNPRMAIFKVFFYF